MFKLLKVGLASALVWFLVEALPAAQPPAVEKTGAERIPRLIAQLGSDEFEEREAATRELGAFGAAALGSLRKAVEADDPEVRRRAEKLIRQIEQRTTTARVLEAKRVRLVYQDTPVTEALADFARKTGLHLQIAGDSEPLGKRRLSLDTGDTTLWDALSQFCRKAGLAERGLDAEAFQDERYEYASGQQRIIALDRTYWGSATRQNHPLLLADGKWQELPTCHAGAVRIRALPPGAPAPYAFRAQGETLLVLEMMPEPQLQMLGVLAVRVDRAIGAVDLALKQRVMAGGLGASVGNGAQETVVLWDGVGQFPVNPFGDTRHVAIRLRLPVPPGKAGILDWFGAPDKQSRSLKEASGIIAAQVRTPSEPLAVVDNIKEAVGRAVVCADGSSLKVVEMKTTDEGLYQVRLNLSSPPPELIYGGVPVRLVVIPQIGRARSVGTVSPENGDFALLDATGRRFAPTSGEVAGSLGKGIGYEFNLMYQPLPNQGQPARLMYTGRRTMIVEVPFTLKNVPLP